MTASRLASRQVEKLWGRAELPRSFGAAAAGGEPIGEIWFQDGRGPESELLVKYLLTREKLSIQVHPDGEAARAAGHRRGKDEAWLVLEAEPGARIGLGLKRKVSAGRASRRHRGGDARGAGRLARGEGGRFLLFSGGHDPRPRAGPDPGRDPGECRSHLPSVRLRPRARAPGRRGREGGAGRSPMATPAPRQGRSSRAARYWRKAARSSSSAGPGPRAGGWPARWSGRSGWCRCAAAA